MQKYLWNGQRGLFVDYDFVQQAQSSYDYVTTFFPLWAGVATRNRHRRSFSIFPLSNNPAALVMSPRESGGQWDFPLCLGAQSAHCRRGFAKYGFNKEADRVSYKFLSTVAENFRRDGTIREKYNAVKRSSETR